MIILKAPLQVTNVAAEKKWKQGSAYVWESRSVVRESSSKWS
jgi:hypothetical protein